jgi:hypothetical protein
MAVLRFRCPYSNRSIDSGIDIERSEALKMRDLPVRIRCPYCDCIHDGTVADGELRDAA